MADITPSEQLRRYADTVEALQRIKNILARSAARQLSIDQLMRELVRPSSRHSLTDVVERPAASTLTAGSA
jgi:hypothetical protein